jgi:ABC-2 type transport system ATP-binding protein
VLLLDEPASGLDPRARVEMRELVRELRRMGKTILVSSHILPELEELCTWVGFIDRGKMVAVGPMAQVRDRVVAGRRLRIDLVLAEESSMRAAEEVLAGHPGVLAVDLLGDHLEITVGEGFEDAELLAHLVRSKVPVRAFAVVAGDLSEAFMRLTGPGEEGSR